MGSFCVPPMLANNSIPIEPITMIGSPACVVPGILPDMCIDAQNDLFEATGCTATCFAEMNAGNAACSSAGTACNMTDAPDTRCMVNLMDGSVEPDAPVVTAMDGVVSAPHLPRTVVACCF